MNVSRNFAWFRSLRWGRSNYGGVLWWVCSPIGQYVIVDELRFQQLDVFEVADQIRAKDEALRMVQPCRYMAAEPMLWKIDTPNAPTLAESFARAKMPLLESSGDRVQGWNQLSALMKLDVIDARDEKKTPLPALVVSESCSQLRRLIPLIREGQGTGQNAREDIDTKTDAALVEALRIGAMSRPQPTLVIGKTPDASMMGHALERARRESRNNQSVSVLI
jgi:hypothetical protein